MVTASFIFQVKLKLATKRSAAPTRWACAAATSPLCPVHTTHACLLETLEAVKGHSHFQVKLKLATKRSAAPTCWACAAATSPLCPVQFIDPENWSWTCILVGLRLGILNVVFCFQPLSRSHELGVRSRHVSIMSCVSHPHQSLKESGSMGSS